MSLKTVAKRWLPAALRESAMRARARVRDPYVISSYSQEGEELILRRIFADRGTGFYVDVGAHHPRRFSNTCTFYRSGWRGINVEPNPEAMRAFMRERKRDINLQIGVAAEAGTLCYFTFDEPALNTFDATLMQWRVKNTPYRVTGEIEIPVERLDVILRRHLPAGQAIDFLSIDVEGLDLAVLQSNDWSTFRPRCILVEVLATSLEGVLDSDMVRFLTGQRYQLFSKLYNTIVFRERSEAP
jgi:FkbM family methyltransferase